MTESNLEFFRTPRLRLRRFNGGDTDFIIELLNSPGWLKYIGDRQVKTAEQARQYLDAGPSRNYRVKGFGLSMVETLESEQPIGMCGVLWRDQLDVPDIGFAFLPAFMGQGYAFEIASATVQFAHDKLHIPRLAAITLPENNRSIHLLQKMNFRLEKKVKLTDEELLQFIHT